MGIFGWSLPPGCSSVPGDEDYPCEVCGNFESKCICPQCDKCGDVGNPACYESGSLCNLTLSQEQITSKANNMPQEHEEIEQVEALIETELELVHEPDKPWLEKKLLEIVSDYGAEAPTSICKLIDLGLDSLDVVESFMAMEEAISEEFAIEIMLEEDGFANTQMTISEACDKILTIIKNR